MLEDKTRRRFPVPTGAVGTALLAGCAGYGPIRREVVDGDGMDEGMDETGTKEGMGDVTDPANAPRTMAELLASGAATVNCPIASAGV